MKRKFRQEKFGLFCTGVPDQSKSNSLLDRQQEKHTKDDDKQIKCFQKVYCLFKLILLSFKLDMHACPIQSHEKPMRRTVTSSYDTFDIRNQKGTLGNICQTSGAVSKVLFSGKQQPINNLYFSKMAKISLFCCSTKTRSSIYFILIYIHINYTYSLCSEFEIINMTGST